MYKLVVLVFAILFLGLSTSFSQAILNQNNGKIKFTGTVFDGQSGKGLEFATVTILNALDSTIVDGTLSEAGGFFSLETKTGEYLIKIEFISYETVLLTPFLGGKSEIHLGRITLNPESKILEDIVITADRSETVFALDKRVFTVGKDLANRGGTAQDILDNVPSVTVDIDGNVSLRGSSGVRILINGRPSGLVGLGNANGLRTISANMIEKVEVITNPSARYEAEGMAGIINIILKKDEGQGFNGSFDIIGGYPARSGASANVNYRKNNINWFANYGLNYNENPGGGFTIQDQASIDPLTGLDKRQFTSIDGNRFRKSISNSLRFGVDYFFTEKDQLTASFLYRISDDNNSNTIIYKDYIGDTGDFDFTPLWKRDISFLKSIDSRSFARELNDELLYSQSTRTDIEFEDERNQEYKVNYKKEFSSREHTLNTSIQFFEKSETEGSDLLSLFDDSLPGSENPLKQFSNNSEGEKTWLFQLDYIHPLGEDHKFEAGLRSSIRQIDNDYIVEEEINGELIPLSEFTNNFIYNEDIQAAYGIYGNTLGKFSYQFGVRAEYTLINTRLLLTEGNTDNKRDFLNLFPSGFLNYNFTEANAIQASYSRRINRPGFWSLNPFFTFSDNRNFFSGNPNVNPEFTDSYEFGQITYQDDFTFSSSLFYRHTKSSIQRITVANKNDVTTLRVPINIGTMDDYGIDLSSSYSGISWLRIDGNFNIFKNKLSLSQIETQQAVFNYYQGARNFKGTEQEFNDIYTYQLNETDNVTWNGRLTFRITIFDSDLQLRSNYRAGQQTSQGQSAGIGSLDIGWSKDFLESKNLTLTLSLRDVFNSRRRDGFTLINDFYRQSDYQWRSRVASLSASYRINQKKKGGPQGSGGFDGGGGDF